MSDVRLVYMTAADENEAEVIADRLLAEKLAACVVIMPGMKSKYIWKGKVCSDQEVVLFAKTMEEAVPALIKTVEKIHSYDCPCIISLPVDGGFPPYIKWVEEQLR